MGRGDLLVVPPGLAQAFAARPDSTADALTVITPGVERFDYFRDVVQVREGRLPRQALLDQQDRVDTYFLDSAAWASARARGCRGTASPCGRRRGRGRRPG